MSGGKHLLVLLAVLVLQARCQQVPSVVRSPPSEDIFSGDLLYLTCAGGGSSVTWYVDDAEQAVRSETWRIAVASPKHSGAYQCGNGMGKSERVSINVLDYSPVASLAIQTGHPVMRSGSSVLLQLDNDGGLQGWRCWVHRRGATQQTRRIAFRPEGATSTVFQTTLQSVPETLLWCNDAAAPDKRSNQIFLRTSDLDVSLEMYPLPAMVGETLTLRCLVWGTDEISHSVFYKDDVAIAGAGAVHATYVVPNVTDLTRGRYKCEVTFTHKARTSGAPYQRISEPQDVFVQEGSVRAVLSENNGLSCSCPRCPGAPSYHWYRRTDGQAWASLGPSPGSVMTPKTSGSYACRAVWQNGRSFPSRSYVYGGGVNAVAIVIGLLVVIVIGLLLLGFAVCRKQRRTKDPVYEDVALNTRSQQENNYEVLERAGGAKREAPYDTLNPGAPPGGEKKDADYQPLNKEGLKVEVYHTLEAAGAAGGESKYEPLRKGTTKEGVYHTLSTEGPAEGDGGYEDVGKKSEK